MWEKITDVFGMVTGANTKVGEKHQINLGSDVLNRICKLIRRIIIKYKYRRKYYTTNSQCPESIATRRYNVYLVTEQLHCSHDCRYSSAVTNRLRCCLCMCNIWNNLTKNMFIKANR